MKNIAYILSDVRSGSTLLENILSNSNIVFSVGELHNIGGYLTETGPGRNWDYRCSCGQQLIECEFWRRVLRSIDTSEIKNEYSTKFNWIYTKEFVWRYLMAVNKKNYFEILLKNSFDKSVLNNIVTLYRAVFEVSQCKCIIDSSKRPWQALQLYKRTNYPFKIVYLRRDIRAVTLSKMKWSNSLDNIYKLYAYLLSTYYYNRICSRLLEKIQPNDLIKISYEDLSKDPSQTIKTICRFLSIDYFKIPQYMHGAQGHAIGGTPIRFDKRPIKYDDTWESESKRKPFFNFLGNALNK